MEKRLYFCIMCFAVSLCAAGCGIFGNTSEPELTPSPAPEEVSLIENEYYAQKQKLDDAYLYVSPNMDFCIQVPNDVKIQHDGDDGSLLSYSIPSTGSVSVVHNNYETYMELSAEEVQKSLDGVELFYDISDFRVITDNNNSEIGRSYMMQNDEGVVIFTQEYKDNDIILKVIGQPADNSKNDIIKMYCDSFMKLS